MTGLLRRVDIAIGPIARLAGSIRAP